MILQILHMFQVTRYVGIITEIFKHVNYHLGLMLFPRYIEVITTECTVHFMNCSFSHSFIYTGGHAVAQLVEALRYKPEGCGFDSRWCHWNFSLT